MRLARFFIYGVPALLIALFIAAFINSTLLTTRKKNELTHGSIGEPAKINPLQSSDQGADEVEGLVFESLLSMDENLKIIPQLAASYEQSQRTTIYFRSAEEAANAAAQLNAAAASWSKWSLLSAATDGQKLVLFQTLPGLRTAESVAQSLEAAPPVPLVTLRAELGRDARKTLRDFQQKHPEIAVEREWFDYDLAFEITIPDRGVDPEKTLTEFLRGAGKKDAVVTSLSRRNFLAEPILRFTLQKGVRWHDGAPFTSRDCVFTYDALMDEAVASPRKTDYDTILKVEAPTPDTFVVTYRRPYSPAILSWCQMRIVPDHVLRGVPPAQWATGFNRHPIGTGPFKFAYWRTNEEVRVVRNPLYWAPGPWLDAVVYRTLPDPTVLRLAFLTHQVDLYPALLSTWALRAFREDPRFTVVTVPGWTYSYLGWNLRKPVFQDVRVRQALAHALNVPDIIKYVNYGNGTQSTGIFPPEFWFANHDIKPFGYDPTLAGKMLDDAGWKMGPDGIRVKDGQRLSFKLITNQGNEARKDIATLAQDSFRKIGVEVNVEIYEWAVFIDRFILKQEFEATVLAWSTPPNWDVSQVWHSSQSHPGQLNHMSYRSPEADRLMEQLGEEYDPAEVIKLAAKLQHRIYEDQPALFINSPQEPYVIWKDSFRIRRPTDHGWIDTPFQIMPSQWYAFVGNVYRPEYTDLIPKNDAVTK